MSKNPEMRTAWEFTEHTSRSIFLTGKAGTGKTTFLKTVCQHTRKRFVVVAPTGVAAINAGGVTIHSFFQLPLTPFIPSSTMRSRFDFSKDKKKIIQTLDLLIIDEISMVRGDLLDAIDSVLRRFRASSKPFGGVQLLMIGDLNQLTPVVTPEDEAVLKGYYNTPYFFGSKALANVDYVTIQLSHVYRQQDTRFISILNHIRDGIPTPQDIETLNSRCIQGFRPKDDEGYIRLTTHNRKADYFNHHQLDLIQQPTFTYTATIKDDFPPLAYPAEQVLSLKVGAQVMFLKNDTQAEPRFYNGRIGIVTYLGQDVIRVRCQGDANDINVEPMTWENTKYRINEQTKEIVADVEGTFTQYPLRLAWAITIHKSQGLTFEHAIIDANQSFAPGQVYVALSRCKSIEGLVLSEPLYPGSIINDDRVADYISHQEEATQRSISRLPELKDEYYRSLLMELFTFTDIQQKSAYMLRVLIEFFQRDYGRLVLLHKTTQQDFGQRIAAVSQKWRTVMSPKTIEELQSEPFGNRIRRSARYFCSNLQDLFGQLLEQTRDLVSGNKIGMKRYNTAFYDIIIAYSSKLETLDCIAQEGFTTASYLKFKQQAVIHAMEHEEQAAKSASRRQNRQNSKAKTQTSKPKTQNSKLSTQAITLDLYRKGLTPEQIAKNRGLTITTIIGHLAPLVAAGQLKAEDLIDAFHAKVIRAIIKQTGLDGGLSAIKQQLPPDYTWGELRIVAAEKK